MMWALKKPIALHLPSVCPFVSVSLCLAEPLVEMFLTSSMKVVCHLIEKVHINFSFRILDSIKMKFG